MLRLDLFGEVGGDYYVCASALDHIHVHLPDPHKGISKGQVLMPPPTKLERRTPIWKARADLDREAAAPPQSLPGDTFGEHV